MNASLSLSTHRVSGYPIHHKFDPSNNVSNWNSYDLVAQLGICRVQAVTYRNGFVVALGALRMVYKYVSPRGH